MANKKQQDWQRAIESVVAGIEAQNVDLSLVNLLSFSFTADAINRYLDIELSKLVPISRTGFHILHTLIRNKGSMTQTEISRSVFRSDHAITRAVDLLEKEGWVRRQRVRGDRRVRKVTITTKGLDLVKNSMAGRLEMSQAAMSCLDEREQNELRSIIRKLRKHASSLIINSYRQNREPT